MLIPNSRSDTTASTVLQQIPGPQRILKAFTGSLGISSLSDPGSGSTPGSEIAEPNTYQQCPNAELSCQSKYQGQNTCCFNYPGGQFLQTQFWDADPAVGPDDSWTIHGLWPDHCNGGFDQFCDSKRRYSNISLILVDAGRGDLLDEMREFWKDYKGDDPNLWEHEWNKHGTCVSTLETHCYSDYFPQQEVVDYFDKTVELFHGLPSYKTLADAGITPSHTKTYTRDEIEDALSQAHGAEVTVRCRNHNLNELWYYFNVAGSLQTGKFVSSKPDGQTSNCPRTGIRYQPKTPAKHPEPTKPGNPTKPAPTGTPFSGKGYLAVSTLGQRRGCLISPGAWYTSGTCATFRTRKSSEDAFTLHSSKGDCAFEEDTFTCGSHISTPSEFSADGEKLAYRGNSTFFADKAPKGPVRSEIFASEEDHSLQLSISWSPR
ncbi:ribonuclease T2-like protein [Aspergillus campestris IBT 28561]|uniref:Ribonuclease T2-like n=1 Tax=Aspergillus campestris (strain IBT 28561) TaxID=1392248 RepID=A0A2I1DEW1_ASPC2|nr:ribonuclease T2-like protein [Aspergillus campestris IBT 28561]PKY08401.1 ribonuclease T2-like protein [Aspergillus campestris IBT 28561]